MGGMINIGSNPGLMGASMGQYAPKACKNLTAKAGNGSVVLKWEDPENYTTTDNYPVEWANTRIVRKTGGYPVDENDGTVVVTSSAKNQYKINGYTDSGLTNYTTYYYRAFSCSTDGVYNHEPVQAMAQPILYRTMTVKINLANSNPETCGSYADDASTMSSGKNVTAWQEFFGYRPCLFKDGKVVGYLNPNDFTKFENGAAADITSGNAGDVMIQFPRRGIRISKSEKIITVSMTDNPNDSSFKYYAHQRGSTDKDYFYLGAYVGYVAGNKLRSLSGKSPKVNIPLDPFDTCGKANGVGYGIIGYYQWLFLQVMYVLQFKGNLNSQSIVGQGNLRNNTQLNTGRSDNKGMIYGDDTVAKLFGIEDIWGNIYQYVNNYFFDINYHVTTTTDDTITNVNNYADQGSYGYSSSSYGWIEDCMGTTEAGFTPLYNSMNGSSYTYFCDYARMSSYSVLLVGGCSDSTYSEVGLFSVYLYGYNRTGSSASSFGSRLGYL